MSGDDGKGWVEYQRLVLAELERHSATLETIGRDLGSVRTEVALLKLKSGVWGALAGLIPAVVVLVLARLG